MKDSSQKLCKSLALVLSVMLMTVCPLFATTASAAQQARASQSKNEKYGSPLKENATVAYFGIVFVDTSTEGAYNGTRTDETQRTALIRKFIAERFASEGLTIVDNAPVQKQLDNTVNPANCYGCELRMAKELGADYVVVGQVQKVSNLILSMKLVMRDTSDGAMVRGMSVDIRSNTDDSWLRGAKYILKNNFFKKEKAK